MKWLTSLEDHDISFNIHILEQNDCILAYQNINLNKIICILDGFIQILQVFTNGETICVQLLYANDLFANISTYIKTPYSNTNHYYKIIALTKTVIATINEKIFIRQIQHNTKLLNEFCHTNFYHNNEITQILSHRNTKKRLIQLLFILIEHFGKFTENNLTIPFNLSHHTIATIIGSQRITVNKIMNELKKNTSYTIITNR